MKIREGRIVGLQGNLRTIILPDVLQWISTSRKTGILLVNGPSGVAKRIFFNQGAIASSASSDPREYLGHFLISRGYLTEEQLNKAMETQIQTGIKLGKILVMVGILEEAELEAMLRLKAEETLYSLFLWDEGDFTFKDLQSIDEDMHHISLDVTSVIMEGIRRKDEWARIRKTIPSDLVVLRATGKPLPPGLSRERSLAARVLAAAGAERSVTEIALELHATEFQVSDAAYHLCGVGCLEVGAEKPSAEEQSYTQVHRRILEEAANALAEGRYEEALNMYRYLAKVMPEDEEVLRGLAMADEGACQAFFRDSVPRSTVLELAIPVAGLAGENLTPQEGFLASRINGSWDIESVLKVSPIPERQALQAIRRLIEKGVLRPVRNR